MKKRIAVIAAVVVIAIVAVAVWLSQFRQGEQDASLSGSGTIEAPEVAVAPLVSGIIVSATATEGAPVKKGDVLFRIDDSVMELQVAQAQAAVNAAAAGLAQARDDDESDAVIAASQAQVDSATAGLRLAQLQLSWCTITSPTDGMVLTRALDAGETAAPGKTLATIGRLDELTVTVYVPEEQIGRVKVGDRATLTTDSSRSRFGCTVSRIASEAEFTPAQVETKEERVKLVYAVQLSLADESGTLKPGMPADVVFE